MLTGHRSPDEGVKISPPSVRFRGPESRENRYSGRPRNILAVDRETFQLPAKTNRALALRRALHKHRDPGYAEALSRRKEDLRLPAERLQGSQTRFPSVPLSSNRSSSSSCHSAGSLRHPTSILEAFLFSFLQAKMKKTLKGQSGWHAPQHRALRRAETVHLAPESTGTWTRETERRREA